MEVMEIIFNQELKLQDSVLLIFFILIAFLLVAVDKRMGTYGIVLTEACN